MVLSGERAWGFLRPSMETGDVKDQKSRGWETGKTSPALWLPGLGRGLAALVAAFRCLDVRGAANRGGAGGCRFGAPPVSIAAALFDAAPCAGWHSWSACRPVGAAVPVSSAQEATAGARGRRRQRRARSRPVDIPWGSRSPPRYNRSRLNDKSVWWHRGRRDGEPEEEMGGFPLMFPVDDVV